MKYNVGRLYVYCLKIVKFTTAHTIYIFITVTYHTPFIDLMGVKRQYFNYIVEYLN
jgi:hypothetical protein